jgi:hypothetical protein
MPDPVNYLRALLKKEKIMNMNFLKTWLVAFMAMLAFFSPFANAAIDLTAVTTGFGDLNTAITTIGGLLLASAVLAVAFKWAKGMIFS